jgi:hypothetical protein
VAGIALVSAFQYHFQGCRLQNRAKGKKFTEKFGEAVDSIENKADFIKQRDREEIKGRIFRMLAYGAVCTKHPGFAEEVEWRVIHFPWWENSAHLHKDIEVIQGVPQPVFKIALEDIPEAGLSGFTIPALFDRIIIGPRVRSRVCVVCVFQCANLMNSDVQGGSVTSRNILVISELPPCPRREFEPGFKV